MSIIISQCFHRQNMFRRLNAECDSSRQLSRQCRTHEWSWIVTNIGKYSWLYISKYWQHLLKIDRIFLQMLTNIRRFCECGFAATWIIARNFIYNLWFFTRLRMRRIEIRYKRTYKIFHQKCSIFSGSISFGSYANVTSDEQFFSSFTLFYVDN